MWVVDDFKEYEVLACGDNQKIERFGKYILKRPDPQAIWHIDDISKYNINAIYHRSKSGGGKWEFIDLPKSWDMSYDLDKNTKIRFYLKPFSFKHVGVFPEQASNWKWFSKIIKDAKIKNPKREIKVLNLFAYTGLATISASLSGAKVTHVDAAKGMVNMAKENATLSKCKTDSIRYIVDDCKKFVEREIRRGNTYEGIIMDPPSYGRGTKGEVWKIEDNIYDLVSLTSKLLSKDSLFFLLNSYTTGLQSGVMEYIVRDTIVKEHGGDCVSGEIGIKVKNNQLILPEGNSVRWKNNF